MRLPTHSPTRWPEILETLIAGVSLTPEQAHSALASILAGEATFAQTSAFLVALRCKGESPEEIRGLSDALLEVAAPLEVPKDCIDIVGTGGSRTLGGASFNVSTMACLVASAAGAVVCKHGNRKASSSSGAADVLEVLGVNVEASPEQVSRCVKDIGLGFAFARVFHPAMRYVAVVRGEIGIPTVFNVLGPISHPARVRRQVLGVADATKFEPIAEVLAARGMDRALVVRGEDGLDEISLTGPTQMFVIEGHDMRAVTLSPAELGLPTYSASELQVGDATANAEMAHEVLDGARGAHRDLVTANAGAGCYVAGMAETIAEGVELAERAIESGAARAKLQQLTEHSHRT